MIAILAESDLVILMIFDRELWLPITLLKIVIESPRVPHLYDMIHTCLEPEDQDPSRTFKVLYFTLKQPNIAS